MPITFKNFSKMLKANKKLSKKEKEKALTTYKRRYKKVQKKIQGLVPIFKNNSVQGPFCRYY